MSRFFFSCLFMGAVCGMVGGLMDSAASAATADSARIAVNSVVPEDFMRFLSLLFGHHTRSRGLHARYILATIWSNPHEITVEKHDSVEFCRGGDEQRCERRAMRPGVPEQDRRHLYRGDGGARSVASSIRQGREVCREYGPDEAGGRAVEDSVGRSYDIQNLCSRSGGAAGGFSVCDEGRRQTNSVRSAPEAEGRQNCGGGAFNRARSS